MLITYAQNREDLYLHVLLHDIKKGFYVDVGANYPTADSVTKFFYDRKWNGINIEPIPDLHRQLSKARPRDINLNIGAGSKKGVLNLRQYSGVRHGWSTFSEATKSLHKNEAFTEYAVQIQPLKDIFKENHVSKIDFLKIDVEGYELEVLKGNDWGRYRPKVVLIEGSDSKCVAFLKKADYLQAFYDGLNTYFVRSDLSSKHTMDNYIKVLLSGETIMTHREYVTKKQLKLTEKVLRHTQSHLTKLQDAYDNITYHVQHPEEYFGVKVMSYAAIKRLVKKLR